MNPPSLSSLLPAQDRLIVIDGGARNGPQDLVGIADHAQFHCFEPSPEEVQRMDWSVADGIAKAQTRGNLTAYPFALCATSGQATLNISRRPGATSTLEPNAEFLSRLSKDHFSEMQDIVERIEVPAITLRDFLQQAGLAHIDFLKLDTQGNELDILRSAGDQLHNISVIMTEVELAPLYVGQPLFHDVAQYLCERGFELIDLRSVPTCRRFHARPDLPPSAYRLLWGDAIFVRRPDDAAKPRALQQGIALAALGYADLAIDLFDRNPALNAAQRAELERFARWAAEPHWPMGRAKRFVERLFGLLISRYSWRRGQQVRSLR